MPKQNMKQLKSKTLKIFYQISFFLIFFINIKRVLILDYDVHHGNGTQDIFKDDDRFTLKEFILMVKLIIQDFCFKCVVHFPASL